MTLERRPRPHELVAGDFLAGEAKDPLAAIMQRFARNLAEALGDRSNRSFERDSGMSNANLVRILKGNVWPDAITIARLELATGKSLWPRLDEVH